ncbi:MAG: response regulator [Synergistaceae bacterium]|jgi:PAS domain S-box-containing protein|nr:response regulator [Synergistaceae bacterium]
MEEFESEEFESFSATPEQECEMLRERCKKLEREYRKLERRHQRLESDYRRIGVMYRSAERLRDVNEADKELQYFYNRLLLQTCADVIFVLDRDMRVVLATDALARFLGLDEGGEIVSYHVESFFARRISSEWTGELFARCRKVFATSQPQSYTQRLVLSNGEKFTADCSLSPAVDKNGVLHGVVFVMHDVTELDRAKEKAEEGSRAKGTFLATMSHEIRTPLNAIIGLSEVEIQNELPGKTRENLEKIYNAGSILLGIVNDILDISKIESGNLELLPAEYDIASLISDTVQLNIVRIGSKNVAFEFSMDSTIPANLYGDELRIKQILNNLLSNAFKYTDEGRVTLRVGWERRESGAWLIFTVNDTGHGIRADDMCRLFEKYTQLDARANRRIEGTGLGLSITKKLVDLMGGTITVESEYGKGSAFIVALPQGIVDETPLGREVVDGMKNFSYLEKRQMRNSNLVRAYMPYGKVLVVDDVPTNLDVARGLMLPYGLTIDFASGGREAIEKIREEKTRYDVVFMDHMMPEMDGIEATRAIRATGTDYARTVPVVALTANALTGNREMFLENGFNDFISKPIDILQLDAALNRWIRDKQDAETLFRSEPAVEVEEVSPIFGFTKLYHVKGIDFAAGVESYVNEGTYLEILRSYLQHIPDLLEKMRSPSRETLNDYMVTVHGLKGASRGICAGEIGKLAEDLEALARAGNFEAVQAGNGVLIEAVEALLSALRELLQSATGNVARKDRKPRPDTDALKKLLEAGRHFRTLEMEEIMAELERSDYESGGELIEWLRQQLDVLEYEAMEKRLQDVLDNE